MKQLPSLEIENRLWCQGYNLICGLDEVGRGCFAGPVVVGAVVFPPGVVLPSGLADSKLLSPLKRKYLSRQIKMIARSWSVAEISVSVINKVGIGKATQMAFRKAIKNLSRTPDYVLVDAFYVKHLNRKWQMAVRNGDTICASISAASIIAKVYRDTLMRKYHNRYPRYGFARHKGYGTKLHQQRIQKFGLTKIHRRSFNLGKFLL